MTDDWILAVADRIKDQGKESTADLLKTAGENNSISKGVLVIDKITEKVMVTPIK